MMKILFVDSCIRPDDVSRTQKLCRTFFDALRERDPDCEIERLLLREEDLHPLDSSDLERRDKLARTKVWGDPLLRYARQFAEAEKIVVGAPYWDLSFPAVLRLYVEQLCISGITFAYKDGESVGLCKAKKLLYISTCGGFLNGKHIGAEYFKAICAMLGITRFDLLAAEGLDIKEIDRAAQLEKALVQAREKAAAF